jgi:hypothetical protein
MLNSKVLLLTVGALFCVVASATPVGTFDINGGTTGEVRVGLTIIDWYPLSSPLSTGTLNVTSGPTGIFAGLTGGGTIHDLDSTVQPVGAPISLSNFLVVTNLPAWSWTATFIYPGLYTSAQCAVPAASGEQCTPFLTSPFNLVDTEAGGSTVGFTLIGTATDGVGGQYDFTAQFTTQFSEPYQSYLPTVLGGGTIDSSWSGTIKVDQVPEPATLLLMSAGLIGLGLIRRVLR